MGFGVNYHRKEEFIENGKEYRIQRYNTGHLEISQKKAGTFEDINIVSLDREARDVIRKLLADGEE